MPQAISCQTLPPSSPGAAPAGIARASRAQPYKGVDFLDESDGCIMTTAIRPNLNLLRHLPTIHQVAEPWGKLELKLETDDTRYWLTTEGVARKTSGTPINYVVDYVTVEKLSDDGSWDLKAVYSPEAWKLSQGFDYSQMLSRDLEQKRAELEERFSWDLVKEIESLERELALTNQVVFDLSEKVRQAWV